VNLSSEMNPEQRSIPNNCMNSISPVDLPSQESILLIDVRTPKEFRACHAQQAINHPLSNLDPQSVQAAISNASPAGDEAARAFVICQGGQRSAQACKILREAGVPVVDIEGGTNAWEAAGCPLVRGEASMSLPRQVRIAAGLLILLGAALGFFVHPGFHGLSAFVGAGLLFAGITNTCGMGMLLAKMPWNQS